jgi:hypothetical protein
VTAAPPPVTSSQPDRSSNCAEACKKRFFATVNAACLGIDIALANLVNTRLGGLVNSKIRLQGAYSVDDWSGPAQPFENPAPYDGPDIGVSLTATLLLSLGIWVVIWAVFASLASALLG